MSDLQPEQKLMMNRNFAIEEADRKEREARNKLQLPPNSPDRASSPVNDPQAIAAIKTNLADVVQKMRAEEQRIFQEKTRDAESILRGARSNLAATTKEYNAFDFLWLRRAMGLKSSLRFQMEKETKWVAACEQQLRTLQRQLNNPTDRDPNMRHAGLVLYEKAEKLEREGKTNEALDLFRKASYAIGNTNELQQQALERTGNNIKALNQNAVKDYQAALREANRKLEVVEQNCRTAEKYIKIAAMVAVMAPGIFLGVGAGLLVGTMLAGVYGLSMYAGQIGIRGRTDWKECAKEAWKEAIGLVVTNAKNVAGGALFKGVGAVFGYLGMGPGRLIVNLIGAPIKGTYKVCKALVTRNPVTNVKAVCSGTWSVCKSGASAAGSSVKGSFKEMGKVFSWSNKTNSPLVLGAEKVSASFSKKLGEGLLNSGAGLVVAPVKFLYGLVRIPVVACVETVKAGLYVLSSPLKLFGLKTEAPFLIKQLVSVAKTGMELFIKDPKLIKVIDPVSKTVAPWRSFFATTLALPAAIGRGSISQFITGAIVPYAPRVISAGTMSFLTGGTASAIEETVRARADKRTFEEHLKKKYGKDITLDDFKAFAEQDPQGAFKEFEDYQKSQRIDLNRILKTSIINGGTMALASVIRIKKPAMAEADKAALTKASDEAMVMAKYLGTTGKVDSAGKKIPAGAAAAFPTGPQPFKVYKDAAKEVKAVTHAGADHLVKPSITALGGKYDVRPLQDQLTAAKRAVSDGKKAVMDHVNIPYAPGKMPGKVETTVAYPKGFDNGGNKFFDLSKDLAARIPSNAYRNAAAFVFPMAGHAYMTHMANLSDPNRRPGESTYTMQDFAKGLFYTFGGVKFGEGYTAGFNKALATSPVDKVRMPGTEKATDWLNKKFEFKAKKGEQPIDTFERNMGFRPEIAMRSKVQLPEANKFMKVGEGRSVYKTVAAEVASDVTKVATLAAAGMAVNEVAPNALPWLAKKFTGMDIDGMFAWFGRRADDAGFLKLHDVNEEGLKRLRTKSINELFEDLAKKKGLTPEDLERAKKMEPNMPTASDFFARLPEVADKDRFRNSLATAFR